MKLNQSVQCPFCGEAIIVGDCPIVATNVTQTMAGFTLGGVGDPGPGQQLPVSGAKVLGTVGGLPKIAEAPNSLGRPKQSRIGRVIKAAVLPALSELASPSDLPARACPKCSSALPEDLDSRRILTIAVVGVNGASKSHFITSMLAAAARDQALNGAFGCTEFAPDEATARVFNDDYHNRVFERRQLHAPTQLEQMSGIVARPLAFRVTFERLAQPCTLLFHDIAGECLTDRAQRARHLSFIRRAAGVIFLVDPWWFPRVAQHLETTFGIRNEHGFHQADLLNAIANDLGPVRLAQVPTAVAVSKSDLLTAVTGGTHTFDREAPADRAGWIKELETIDNEVRGLLETEFPSPDLLAAASRFGSPTFHAVAPIGCQPRTGVPVDHVAPRRCLDPLVSILLRSPEMGI